MKTLPMTAIVALMTATMGLSAVAPAFAQDAAPAAPAAQTQTDMPNKGQHDQGPRRGGHMGGGDILNFERGTEAVEIAFVRLSHSLELTAAQQPLFDAFKTEAIKAATDFATKTEGLRPTPPDQDQAATTTTTEPTPPTAIERLDNRVAVTAAQLAALEAIQPSATAFFNSLTADQLTQLTPQRPEGDEGPGKGGPRDGGPRHGGDRGHGPKGHDGEMGGPGAPPAPGAELAAPPAAGEAPAAPAEAPAAAPAVNG